MGFDSNAILGTTLMVATTIVIAFILFGNLLNATGGGDFFNDISIATMGRYRGGSAKIAVVSSALFGTISGSAVANVVSGGIVTIPLMIRTGYKNYQAAAIEAVASTGGSIMPPVMGAAAFVMAEFLQVTVRRGHDRSDDPCDSVFRRLVCFRRSRSRADGDQRASKNH